VAASTLFAGVDRAAFAAAFAQRLRRVGLDAPLSATERFTAGLSVAEPLDRGDLYWLARISFVTRHEQIPLFDSVFAAVFDEPSLLPPTRRGAPPPMQRSEDAQLHGVQSRGPDQAEAGAGLPWATRPAVVGRAQEDADAETRLPELLASAGERLADKPFDELDEDELRIAGLLLETAFSRWPERRSRRRRYGRRGASIAYRPTLRRALRSGGEPIEILRLRPRVRPRPVVALVDVSGSMESFARGYLHVMRALAVAGRAEVFAFATSLTRLTAALRHHSAVEAVAHASELVRDRFGGTRLATSIGELLHDPVWSSQVRGALVLIASDGCDTDPPDILRERMARLRRLAHEVVWINPRIVAPDYEPLVGGMAAALPFCDRLLSGHSLAAIDEVIEAIVGD
jgi:hypothetical protein